MSEETQQIHPGEVVVVSDESAMIGLAEQFAEVIRGDPAGARVVLLDGEMGAGKTVFVKGLARGFGLRESMVQSPTFTLVNEYRDESGALRLIHSDLYRLGPDEVEGTGLLDLLENPPAPCAVEWPDRLPWSLDAVTLRIARRTDDANGRSVEWVEADGRRLSRDPG